MFEHFNGKRLQYLAPGNRLLLLEGSDILWLGGRAELDL
jgi:hypothetical protein